MSTAPAADGAETHTINFHFDDNDNSDSEVSANRRSSLRAPAPNVEPVGNAPDVDVEETGQGFFNRQSTLAVLKTQPVDAAPANTKPAEVEMTSTEGLLAKPRAQEEGKTQPDAVVVPIQHQLKPGEHAPPSDSLWLISLEEVAALFPDSDLDPVNTRQSGGLTSAKAAELLLKNGRNELKPPAEHSEIVKYLLCFTDPFMVLLGTYRKRRTQHEGRRKTFGSICS